MSVSVDPDQMPHFVASDLGLHCLLRHICLNILGKYGNLIWTCDSQIKASHKEAEESVAEAYRQDESSFSLATFQQANLSLFIFPTA